MTSEPRIRFLVCDLDNTLYPSESGLMHAVGRLINRYMIDRVGLSPEDAERLRQRYYRRFGATMRGLVVHHAVDPEDYLAFVHNLPLERFIQANPALDAMLAKIPLRKSIFTNSTCEHAQRVLDILGIGRHFEHIVDVREFDFNSKPHPSAYRRMLQILDARPDECILVDDTIFNLAPAQAMGMVAVLIGNYAPVDERTIRVDAHIEDILELADAIQPWLDTP
jgi:putative hydrolase of the HAD superfamily